jgi:hypothetical protein
MTKLPPGRACFPQHPTGAVKLLEEKNYKHAWRWLLVRQLRDMTPDMTWENTFKAVAEVEAAFRRDVAWQTIEGSYKKVESAIKARNGRQFFISDWPPDEGAKNPPRF